MIEKTISEKVHKELSYDTDVSPGIVEIIAGVRSSFMKARIAHNLDNFGAFEIYVKTKTFIRDISEILSGEGYQIAVSSYDKMCAIKALVSDAPATSMVIVDYDAPTRVFTFGDKEEVDRISAVISSKFNKVINNLSVYSAAVGGGVSRRDMTVDSEDKRLPEDWMYPFLSTEEGVPFDVKDFYAQFLESREPILLLIGPPGTGKTTFIRGLMIEHGLHIGITYDKALMDTGLDSLLAEMYEGNCEALVFEDSDTLIRSREDGNDAMAALLNTSDGLIPNPNKKKIIFSTNLESLDMVDAALLRPGRCFAILEFKLLNPTQASEVASKMGVAINADSKSTWTLADISHAKEEVVAKTNVRTKRRKIGF